MSKPRKNKKAPGPCPDPSRYILVDGKAGKYWRLKRGTLKPAKLNSSWEVSRRNTQISSPAARQIMAKLAPFTAGMDAYGRAGALSGMLRKSLNVKGNIDYSFFKDFDMQQDFPLSKVLMAEFIVAQRSDILSITIPLGNEPVKAHNRLVTDYFFEAILLHGDPTQDNGLRVESDQSPLYSFGKVMEGTCTLILQLPGDTLWMVWLKVSCVENDRPAVHPKHHGMKVVAVG